MSLTSGEFFGSMPDGGSVYSYDLTNESGMTATIINFGAALRSLKIPLKNGEVIDVVLGFDNLASYLQSYKIDGAPYLGATVGRYAGRISNGSFPLNGRTIQLNKNIKNHALHGGFKGFSQACWAEKKVMNGKCPSITLTYLSKHLEENYPGELNIDVTYTLNEENELVVEYQARSCEDTIINIVQHSYFNLEGHQSDVSGQELYVNSAKILETAGDIIPTGRYIELKGDAFDFSIPKKCPLKIDHTFVLKNNEAMAASLFSKKNQLKMEVYTNQPAVHIYIGGNCGPLKGKGSCSYHSNSGICFETEHFPDAPNHDHFPSPVLKKGEIYHHKTIYKFLEF